MGSRLSIDKHVSNLEDILELNTRLLEKVKFESNIPDCITQHLKIWRFQEDNQQLRKVRSEPANLSLIQTSGFNFLSNECYLVLLIYKKAHEEYNQFLSFPHQMWGVVESYSNLTPRGLECPIAASECIKETFDSFLLPRRQMRSNEFEYMIFAWNGKQANPLVKAQALSSAFELENLLNKGKDPLLKILFSGGVIRNKKLSKGSIVQLSSDAQTTEPSRLDDEMDAQSMRETVYLLNFLFPLPPTVAKKREFSKLSDFLKRTPEERVNYRQKFTRLSGLLNLHTDDPYQQPIIHRLSEQQQQHQSEEQYSEQYEQQQVSQVSSEEISAPPSYREQESSFPKGKVPSLNFQQLSTHPKFELNLKNVSNQTNKQTDKEVDIGVPLVEGVEYSEVRHPQLMKLSLGNLKLGQREEPSYKDIEEEDKEGFNFDIRDTDRKKLKIQYFAETCSEVVKDFLYVGGEQIANNRDVLKELCVSHVINCAGDVCVNRFPHDFEYTTYYLKDSKTENIECIFYEVINALESVRQSGGRVLIHCVQGVSRSVSLCIAYLIFKEKLSYSEAFDHIKKQRGVASPNMGFTVQLLLFQKRLQTSYDSIPVNPRVFAIGRGVAGNNNVVCRMLMDQLFSGKLLRTFDSRGVFLVVNEHELCIWIGPECVGAFQECSVSYALFYVDLLKLYENAPKCDARILRASQESERFWELWGLKERPSIVSQKVKDWEAWYEVLDLEEFDKQIESQHRLYHPEGEQDNGEQNQQLMPQTQRGNRSEHKPQLFVHPNCDEPLGIFDLEDLDHQILGLLIKQSQDRTLQVFIWRGTQWNGNDDIERNFVDDLINQHFSHLSHENIFIYKEEPNDESDEFLDCFQ